MSPKWSQLFEFFFSSVLSGVKLKPAVRLFTAIGGEIPPHQSCRASNSTSFGNARILKKHPSAEKIAGGGCGFKKRRTATSPEPGHRNQLDVVGLFCCKYLLQELPQVFSSSTFLMRMLVFDFCQTEKRTDLFNTGNHWTCFAVDCGYVGIFREALGRKVPIK